MSGFPILDLLLGLVFIFFILSIISSAVVEVVMTKMNYRSKILTRWLMTIFDKQLMQPDGNIIKLGQAIADHCLTTALAKEGQATSFMDAKNFVSALIEKVTFNPANPNQKMPQTLQELLDSIENATALDGSSLLSTELRRTILLLGSEAKMLAPATITTEPNAEPPLDAKNSFQIFREKLEAWFDSSMDRIGGKMKKKYTRPLTFWVGLVVVVSLNADAISISRYLYDHKEEAKSFADKAQVTAQAMNDMKDTAATRRIQVALDSLKGSVPSSLPLGWTDSEKNTIKQKGIVKAVGAHLPGWFATVMAIMLGAPFWFDMINKLSNIRGTGAKPQSQTQKGKDEGK